MAQERDFQVIQKLHFILESSVDATVLRWTEDGHTVRLLYRRRPQLQRLLQVSFRVLDRVLSKFRFTHTKDTTTRDDLYCHSVFRRASRPELLLKCFTEELGKRMDAIKPSKSELQWPLVSFDSHFGPLEIQFQIHTTGKMEGCHIIVAPTPSMPVSFVTDQDEDWSFAPSTFPGASFDECLDANAFEENRLRPENIGDTFETNKMLFPIPSGLLNIREKQMPIHIDWMLIAQFPTGLYANIRKKRLVEPVLYVCVGRILEWKLVRTFGSRANRKYGPQQLF
ncbi:hypothetical protein ABG067_006929 [Albugo candida]